MECEYSVDVATVDISDGATDIPNGSLVGQTSRDFMEGFSPKEDKGLDQLHRR